MKTCRRLLDAASIALITGTSSNGWWCTSRALLQELPIPKRSYSRPAGFRMAYDALQETTPLRSGKEYLKILKLLAEAGEVPVEGLCGHCTEERAESANIKVEVDPFNEC